MLQLQEQVAVITGASSGIGQGIAIAYAAEGAKVALAARGRAALEEVAGQIWDAGGTAIVIPTDVTVEDDVVHLFRATTDALGCVDILVNSAGISMGAPTDELSLEVWRTVLDVNLTGAFLCSREAFKVMKRQRSGRIINIGSVSSKVPRPNAAPYTASKFGLEGLTRSLALDARDYGIAVCILHPGNTASALWEGRESITQIEGIMAASDLARVAVIMAALPPDVNMLESTVLPVGMPFLGRG
jgi:NAD(P)-dependent dehydrogenase (short-subunit alcohol dehydrogenase family)